MLGGKYDWKENKRSICRLSLSGKPPNWFHERVTIKSDIVFHEQKNEMFSFGFFWSIKHHTKHPKNPGKYKMNKSFCCESSKNKTLLRKCFIRFNFILLTLLFLAYCLWYFPWCLAQNETTGFDFHWYCWQNCCDW